MAVRPDVGLGGTCCYGGGSLRVVLVRVGRRRSFHVRSKESQGIFGVPPRGFSWPPCRGRREWISWLPGCANCLPCRSCPPPLSQSLPPSRAAAPCRIGFLKFCILATWSEKKLVPKAAEERTVRLQEIPWERGSKRHRFAGDVVHDGSCRPRSPQGKDAHRSRCQIVEPAALQGGVAGHISQSPARTNCPSTGEIRQQPSKSVRTCTLAAEAEPVSKE